MTDPLCFEKIEEGIILMTVSGDITEDMLSQFEEGIVRWKEFLMLETNQGKNKVSVVVDVTAAGPNYSMQAMRDMVELMKWNRNYIKKTALFGIPYSMSLVAETLKVLSGRLDIESFGTREEAVAWVKS